MLPVIVGNHRAAQIVLLNTVALVLVSILPFFWGLGWAYLACAVIGGGIFLYYNLVMLLRPSAAAAMKSFFASLLQLVFLLTGCLMAGLTFG